jgi:hypothetical protein
MSDSLAEISSSYTAIMMCPTDDCLICECPRDKLDRTDTTYELRSGEKIKSMVEAAQADSSGGAAESGREHQEPLQNKGIHLLTYIISYSISWFSY